MGEIFNVENMQISVKNLLKKNDNCGIDGIMISQYEEYWKLNGESIVKQLNGGDYEPDVVQMVEIIDKKGKKRMISKYTCTDRVILDVIKRWLDNKYEGEFSEYSYAYQINKGISAAVRKSAEYMEDNEWVVEIDIKDFFENISIERLRQLLKSKIDDANLLRIIEKYLHCKVQSDNFIGTKEKGIIQGSPMSPILSNIYMMDFDGKMEKSYKFCRFSDNINIYCETEQMALNAKEEVITFLKEAGLEINVKKTGIYRSIVRTYLGYEFYRKSQSEKRVYIRKKQNYKLEYNNRWKSSCIQKIDKQYHILSDGIITRKDYTILFENEEGKMYIPVETTDTINIYSNISFNTTFFEYVSKKGLQINIFNKYGKFVGSFNPNVHYEATKMMFNQVEIYNNGDKRLVIAKAIEIASLHNQRENLRYFYKHNKNEQIETSIKYMTMSIDKIKKANSVEELMLYEAQGKQKYYQCFDIIINDSNFLFDKRTKRPPKNEVNAMISFGNVFLYQRIATMIYKTSLDIRIGFVHAANSRRETLNLDIAEIFKPIIVDKVVFKMIHRLEIDKEADFEPYEEGIFLSKSGKKKFIKGLEDKLYSKIQVNGLRVTYDKLMYNEIKKLMNYIRDGEKYKPYKYT